MREGDNFDLGVVEELIKQNRGNKVTISEDKMSVLLELVQPPEGKEYTEKDIIELLMDHGVRKGILHDVIKQMSLLEGNLLMVKMVSIFIILTSIHVLPQ